MTVCQRDRFNIPDGVRYLNCAFMAPLSDRVAESGRDALDRLRDPSRLTPAAFFRDSDETRRLFARLIGAGDPQRIAIVPSVSYGLAAVARNVSLRAGQNVVVLREQFPSNVYTWSRLCRTNGAELRVVSPPEESAARAEAWNSRILDAIDARTGVVAIPELHWTDGTRYDLDQIGGRARQCGAVFVVDGTQSVGATPFDVERVQPDALLCAGYKWLTGPYGLGLAYLGPMFDDGLPVEENWIARLGSENFAGLIEYCEEYQPGVLRYDVGERSNFILLPMLKTALMQVLEWRPALIQEYCRALTAEPLTELRSMGCRIETDEWRRSHLFGIRMPRGADLPALAAELEATRVIVSVRGSSIRVAPHLYNDPEDLHALVAAVRNVISRPRSTA